MGLNLVLASFFLAIKRDSRGVEMRLENNLSCCCCFCCCCFGFIGVSFKKNISARIQNGTVMGNAYKCIFLSLSLLIKIILKENQMDIYRVGIKYGILLTVSDIWAVVLQNFIPLVLSASREKRGIFLIFPFLQKPMGVYVLKKRGI